MPKFLRAFSIAKSFSSDFWWLCCATLFNQFGNMAAVFLVIYLHESLGWSVAQSSTAFATQAFFLVCSGMLLGRWIDYFGGRRLILIALTLNALILFLFSQLRNPILIFLFCAIWGTVYGCYRPASQTLVSEFSPKDRHQLAFSVYRFFINLGMSVGPAVGGYLAKFHFSWIFMINAVANLSAAAIVFYGISKKEKEPVAPSSYVPRQGSFQVLKSDPYLLWCLCAMVLSSMVFFQFESTLVVYLRQSLQLPLPFYGFLLTVNTGLIVLTEIPINLLTSHWRMRTNLILGAVLFALGFGGYFFAQTGMSVLLLVGVWTLGEIVLFPASTAYVASLASADNRGSYMGAFSTSTNLGLLLGPWLGGLTFNWIGVPQFWLVVGLLGFLSAFLFYIQPMKEN